MGLLIQRGVGIHDSLGQLRVSRFILGPDVPLQSITCISVAAPEGLLQAGCDLLAFKPRDLLRDDWAAYAPFIFREKLDLHDCATVSDCRTDAGDVAQCLSQMLLT